MKTSELIFSQGKSIFSYPFKVIFRDTQVGDEVLIISVPKKIFKRAVKRNLLKRRLRESYRRQKHTLAPGIDLLLTYSTKEILPYEDIYSAVAQVIEKANKIAAKKAASNETDAQ